MAAPRVLALSRGMHSRRSIHMDHLEALSQEQQTPNRRNKSDAILFFCAVTPLVGAFVCATLAKPDENAQLIDCGDKSCFWSAFRTYDSSLAELPREHEFNFELWDFVFSDGDIITDTIMSGEHSRGRQGKAKLSFGRAPFDAAGESPGDLPAHPGLVYLKGRRVKRGERQFKKQRLILQFKQCAFYKRRRLALEPVVDDCIATNGLVAHDLYSIYVRSVVSLGTAPVRVFYDRKYIGLFMAAEWATERDFLERHFGETLSSGTRRMWQGYNHFSLDYVGEDRVLYQRGCRSQGCPFCQVKDRINGYDVPLCHEHEDNVTYDCKECLSPRTVFYTTLGDHCCESPHSNDPYKLWKEWNDGSEKGDAFKDLTELITRIHKAVQEGSDSMWRSLTDVMDVKLLVETMAVDVMIGNFDGFWANGANYFVYQWGAYPEAERLGTFNILQKDFELTFSMPPEGGSYDDSHTYQIPFPNGLSMCCTPPKAMAWPMVLSQNRTWLDQLLHRTEFRNHFTKKLHELATAESVARIIQMFKKWFDILRGPRRAELEKLKNKGYQRMAITRKDLQRCSVENLEQQLEFTVRWIEKRAAYVRNELKAQKQ